MPGADARRPDGGTDRPTGGDPGPGGASERSAWEGRVPDGCARDGRVPDGGARDGRAPDGGARDGEAEELRRLLERAVPRLPAPAERVDRVRDRVLRRRRRLRAGGVGSVTVAVALLVAVVWQGTHGLGGEAGDGTRTAIPPAGPPDASRSDAVRYPELAGLTVPVPEEWHARAGTQTTKHGLTRGFLSSQPIDPARFCPKSENPALCQPVGKLRPGDAVITLDSDGKYAVEDRFPVTLVTAGKVSAACARVGGTETVHAWLSGPPAWGGKGSIRATVCLAKPPKAVIDEVRRVLGAVTYDGSAPAAPGGATVPPGHSTGTTDAPTTSDSPTTSDG